MSLQIRDEVSKIFPGYGMKPWAGTVSEILKDGEKCKVKWYDPEECDSKESINSLINMKTIKTEVENEWIQVKVEEENAVENVVVKEEEESTEYRSSEEVEVRRMKKQRREKGSSTQAGVDGGFSF